MKRHDQERESSPIYDTIICDFPAPIVGKRKRQVTPVLDSKPCQKRKEDEAARKIGLTDATTTATTPAESDGRREVELDKGTIMTLDPNRAMPSIERTPSPTFPNDLSTQSSPMEYTTALSSPLPPAKSNQAQEYPSSTLSPDRNSVDHLSVDHLTYNPPLRSRNPSLQTSTSAQEELLVVCSQDEIDVGDDGGAQQQREDFVTEVSRRLDALIQPPAEMDGARDVEVGEKDFDPMEAIGWLNEWTYGKSMTEK